MLKNTKDFTLGADPEFCCINTRGHLVKSNEYTSKNAGFGRDDNQWVFESHPEPDVEPRKIQANIASIFKNALSHPNFSKWKWISGSSYKDLPFGGHIHFGINNKIISAKDACSEYLDHYVGLITLLLEDKQQALARRKYNLTPGGHEVHYGLASDFREKKYGFEYRTPSSWLSSPKVALGILCLAKVVMYEVINNRKDFTFDYYAEANDFSEYNVARVRKLFPRIWNDITRMYLYQEYRCELQYLYDLIVKKKSWLDKHEDMRISWCGFVPTAKVRVSRPKIVKNDDDYVFKSLFGQITDQEPKIIENIIKPDEKLGDDYIPIQKTKNDYYWISRALKTQRTKLKTIAANRRKKFVDAILNNENVDRDF